VLGFHGAREENKALELAQESEWKVACVVKWVACPKRLCACNERPAAFVSASDPEAMHLCVVPGTRTAAPWLDEVVALVLQVRVELPASVRIRTDTFDSTKHVGDVMVERSMSLEQKVPRLKCSAMVLSEKKRQEGNDLHARRQFDEALVSYCEAVHYAQEACVLENSKLDSTGDATVLERSAQLNLSLILKEIGEWRAAVLRCDELSLRIYGREGSTRDAKLAFRRGSALCKSQIDYLAGAREYRCALAQNPEDNNVASQLSRAELNARRVAEKRAAQFESNYAVKSVALATRATPPSVDLTF